MDRGLATFVEVGEALIELRERGEYRTTHGTFDAYVRERFGFSIRQAQRLMQATREAKALPAGTEVPVTERAARRQREPQTRPAVPAAPPAKPGKTDTCPTCEGRGWIERAARTPLATGRGCTEHPHAGSVPGKVGRWRMCAAPGCSRTVP